MPRSEQLPERSVFSPSKSRSHLAWPVLLLTITSMVLIGIQPFASKKILILVVALLCLSSAICFADSLFMSLHSTPNGRQLNRIKPILRSVSECTVQPPSLVACESLDGRFAQDAGWILPEACVLSPSLNWLAHRSEEGGDHSCAPLCTDIGPANTARLPPCST
jgi:hypothetical protein